MIITQYRPAEPQIGPHSRNALGVPISATAVTWSGTAAAWPVASKAIYYPIRVHAPCTAYKFWYHNGSVFSGNLDLGLFGEDGAFFGSTGSIAQVASGGRKVVDVTDIPITIPGRYYVGCVFDNITGRLIRCAPPAITCQVLGLLEQASAFPLPTGGATFAVPSSAYIGLYGITTRADL